MKREKLTAMICVIAILVTVLSGITGIGGGLAVYGASSPVIVFGALDSSNSYIDVNFDNGVYGANDGVTALTADKLQLALIKNGGTVSNVSISSVKKADSDVEASASSLTGGETIVRVFITINGVPSGTESISITPASATSIFDKDGNAMAVDQTTSNKLLNDKTAPVITALNPADNSTGAEKNANLVITFDSAVAVGSGNIVIRKKSDTSIAETISAEGSQVTGRNTNTITINPANDFTASEEYYVQIDNTAFRDMAGNYFAGITDAATWIFTTKALSSNASLAGLSLSSGTLTPAFDPAVTNYTVSVPYAVSSLKVTPTGVTGASIKVNSVSVSSGSESGEISFYVGDTTINAEVTAEDNTKKLYKILVTRGVAPTATPTPPPTPTPYSMSYQEPAPTVKPTPTVGPTPTATIFRYEDDRTDDDANSVVSYLTVKTATKSDGTVSATARLDPDQANEIIQVLKKGGKDTAVIVIPDAAGTLSETIVKIPKDSLSALANADINVKIETPNAQIAISQVAMANVAAKMDEVLYFRLIPLKKGEARKTILERAKKESIVKDAIGNKKVSVEGTPQIIETNMPSAEVHLTLPLTGVTIPSSDKERQAYLNKLAVYIEHSDKTKEIVSGKEVILTNGATGLEIPIKKFSTFTIIKSDSLASKSNACSITKVSAPSSTDIKGKKITAAVKNTVTSLNIKVSVSKNAAWKLYKDARCTKEISSKELILAEGKNKAYLKVTAENGANIKVYTLIITRKRKI